ncbi:hypothetical protein S40285_10186 [Stachybotrys chlorohalonatus IBT 40285]|uniref:Uncharacterized protein n=1 Tax=Stachybotrys chlorohalonatus (strain IBT 40285) TaxID=1283841 RepID=A0A084QJC2_STAC4|nr:hypothetical protein S40285_10186 [Stachybotrys chlorohalonata IBT 40285]
MAFTKTIAVARTYAPPRLHALPLTTARHVSSRAKPPPGTVKIRRFVPEDAQPYYKANGCLVTTPDVQQWFRKMGINHDHGDACYLKPYLNLYDILRPMSLQVAYTAQHVINPFHVQYFTARGHALRFHMQSTYARKTVQEPLWIHCTLSQANPQAVVRTIAYRRIKARIFEGLRDLGYSQDGVKAGEDGGARRIRGTMILTGNDAMKLANGPSRELGKLIAGALHEHYSTPLHGQDPGRTNAGEKRASLRGVRNNTKPSSFRKGK